MEFKLSERLLAMLKIWLVAIHIGVKAEKIPPPALTPITETVLSNKTSRPFLPQNFNVKKCLQKSNSLLCNEADDYPWKEVQEILLSRRLPMEFFGNDSTSSTNFDYDGKNHSPLDKYVGNNDSDLGDEYNTRGFCETRETLEFPKIALNKNMELRYIIQGETNSFRRGILTESCIPNTQCMFASHLPPEISVRCVEKHLTKKLIALNPSTGDPYVDEFPIPACCICMFMQKNDF